ncbi:methyl-accepting chemotaxis protein [Robbsia andropogonis]|uniref:methyl-accepting chemotaxis protein n=1 Tax=Robbsia andropogonis TaxID=28092 RepID=UPI000464E3AC|nr:methyl-accepting chemotaxis protein [Robbsia andropogonis]
MSLSIKARVGLTSGLLAIMLVAIGGLGIYGLNQSNAALKNTFKNQMPAVRYTGDSVLNATQERTTARRAMASMGNPKMEESISAGLALRADSDKAWSQFMAIKKSPESLALATAMQEKRIALQKAYDAVYASLRNNDAARASDEMVNVATNYAALLKSREDLNTFLSTKAENGYNAATSTMDMVMNFTIAAMIVGVLLAIWSWWSLGRAIGVPLRSALGHFDAISEGDLRARIAAASNDEMGQLMGGLSKMQESLVQTVSSVRSGSEAIATASQQIAAGNNDLSSRTEQQAASLQETAASMEQLTATVRHNTENARQASGLSSTARDAVLEGSEIVAQVVETMAGINESSGKIADIIGMIEGISFQTNILALNAAVEAARAGEQGRGFAVVAGEVRSLAQRSSAAAKEIKELIETSGERVQTGTNLVSRAGDSMDRIGTAIQRVTDIMGEIAAASDEQSRGIEQVNQAVSQMDEVTQQNAALVEQAAAAAGSLESQAAQLRELVSVFKVAA